MTDSQQPQPGGDELEATVRQLQEAEITISEFRAYILAEVIDNLSWVLTSGIAEVEREAEIRNRIQELRQAAIARFGKGETVINAKGEVG